MTTTPTTTPSRPSRTSRRTIVLVVLGATGVLVLGTVSVGAIALCSALGCTFFEEDFEPDGEEATRSRAVAQQVVAQRLDTVTAGREVVAEATLDGCRVGQNNWKIKDTYSNECFVVGSRVVRVLGDSSFADVGDALVEESGRYDALGCTSTSARARDLAGMAAEYWREDNSNVGREGAAGLPSVAYDCPPVDGVEPGSVAVEVDPTSARAVGGVSAVLGVSWLDRTLSGAWYDEGDLAAVTGSGSDLALVVTVRVGYYDTEF